MANRAKDQNNTIHNNNTEVFATHINKNTGLMLVTPAGKVTEWKDITENDLKKVCKNNLCVDMQLSKQKGTHKFGLALSDQLLQSGSHFREKALSCVLMPLSVLIL